MLFGTTIDLIVVLKQTNLLLFLLDFLEAGCEVSLHFASVGHGSRQGVGGRLFHPLQSRLLRPLNLIDFLGQRLNLWTGLMMCCFLVSDIFVVYLLVLFVWPVQSDQISLKGINKVQS